MFTTYYKKLLASPLWVRIILVCTCLYLLYWCYAHPLVGLLVEGLVMLLPFLLKMLWAMVKYFAVLIVLQVIFAKLFDKSWHQKIAWLGVILLTSCLDSLGVFGHFSWNPLKLKASIAYFGVQLQLLSCYYIMILLILPAATWGILNQIFILLMSLLSSGVGLIPIVGSLLGTVLSTALTFAILTFLVLNWVAKGLLYLDKFLRENQRNNTSTTHEAEH